MKIGEATIASALAAMLALLAVYMLAACGAGDPAAPATQRTGLSAVPLDELTIPTVQERELRENLSYGGFDDKVQVRVDGSSVYYSGPTSWDGLEQFSAALDRNPDVRELRILSMGGEVFWGIKLGELVFDRGLDVRVEGACISSCANYIFPAGRNKTLAEGSVVGWHGSAVQPVLMAKKNGVSPRQQMLDDISQAILVAPAPPGMRFGAREFREALEQEIGRQELRIRLEEAFYRKLGLRGDFAVYGFLPRNLPLTERKNGWTFSLRDMEDFGIGGIEYLGEAYPDERQMAILNMVELQRN